MIAAQSRVFASVFPTSSTANTVPTPVATPILGFTSEGQSFGGPQTQLPTEPASPSDRAAEQVKWNRAWHIATSFLKLPEEQVPFDPANLDESQPKGRWTKRPDAGVSQAVSYLLSASSKDHASSVGHERDGDLVAWYTNEVRRHFLTFVRPTVTEVCFLDLGPWILEGSLED